MQHDQFLKKAAPLLLVLFIDGLGLSLVFPILTAILADPQTGFFVKAITPTMHSIIFGATIGIFMLCWFFGAAILGELSDQIGRKKCLLLCLVGGCLGYLLSAIAVNLHSLTLLIIGRIVAGFTSGSQPIAQAAIIDISLPQYKTRNIGMIMFAMSLGFVVGPLIGGFLSDNSIVAWFNFSTPFYFAAIISLINAFLLIQLFKETIQAQKKAIVIKFSHSFTIFISAFRHHKVRVLSIILFIFMLGWSSFYSFIPMYVTAIYHFTPSKVSLYMAVMGLGFGLGNFTVEYFTRRFSLKNNAVGFILLGDLLIFITLVTPQQPIYAWLLVAFLAGSLAIVYSAIITLFSNQVDASAQGWIMGITGSIMAFVFGITGFIGGLLASWHVTFPIIISVVALLIAALFMWKFFNPAPQILHFTQTTE